MPKKAWKTIARISSWSYNDFNGAYAKFSVAGLLIVPWLTEGTFRKTEHELGRIINLIEDDKKMPEKFEGLEGDISRINEKLSEIQKRHDELVQKSFKLKTEGVAIEDQTQLNAEFKQVNYDEVSWTLAKVEAELGMLGNSTEDEKRRAELLQRKIGLEKEKKSRGESLAEAGDIYRPGPRR